MEPFRGRENFVFPGELCLVNKTRVGRGEAGGLEDAKDGGFHWVGRKRDGQRDFLGEG